jgi:predicted Fe-S protein YdhL (DUF1289 family)
MAFGVRIFVCQLCLRARIEGSTEWYHYDSQPAEIRQIISALTSRTLCSGCRNALEEILRGGN